MAHSRRRAHPIKLVLAVLMLAIAAVVAAAAIITGTIPALTGASVLGVVAGVVAAALMFAEIVVMRRLWAYDRARLADSYRVHDRTRHAEHADFVGHVTDRIADVETQLVQANAERALLQEAVLNSEIETALAQERLAAEQARIQALEADAESAATDLASARADLVKAQDALAASESAGVAARAEILVWEEAAASEAAASSESGHRSLSA